MAYLRRLIQYLAFTVGLIALANLTLAISIAICQGYGLNFVILLPVVVGGLLALMTARAAVSREWQKGPALVLAASYLAFHFREIRSFELQMPEVNSWWDVAGRLLVGLVSNLLIFLTTIVVYRGSDRTLRESAMPFQNASARPRALFP
jgi:hypothetical protein